MDGNIFASTYTVVFTDGNKLHLQLDPGPGAKSNNATLTAFGIGTIIDYGNRDAVLTVTVNWGNSLWVEVTPLASLLQYFGVLDGIERTYGCLQQLRMRMDNLDLQNHNQPEEARQWIEGTTTCACGSPSPRQINQDRLSRSATA